MENTKTSKVTSVTANGTWDSQQYGTFYKFEVTFENGDTGEYSSKTIDQTKFVEGQQSTYTMQGRDVNGTTYYRIKPAQPQGGFTGGGGYGKPKDPATEQRIARMSVLKVAGDLAIAQKIKTTDITAIAQLLEKYVMTGDDTMNALKSNDSDLPF